MPSFPSQVALEGTFHRSAGSRLREIHYGKWHAPLRCVPSGDLIRNIAFHNSDAHATASHCGAAGAQASFSRAGVQVVYRSAS